MTTDSQDFHRKHRRSPSDDESPESSKRRKHRHHRRHRSKHAADDVIVESEKKSNKAEKYDKVVVVAKPPPDIDEMEEGEIIEEDAMINNVDDNKVGSDVESGELADVRYVMEGDDVVDNDRKSPRGDVKKHRSRSRYDESPVSESIVNGDGDYRKRSSKSRRRSKSPSKGSREYKDKRRSESKVQDLELMEADEERRGDRKHSHKDRRDRGTGRGRSPTDGGYRLEESDRNRSASPDRRRGRERSQSVVYEGRSRRGHLYENGKVDDDWDDTVDRRENNGRMKEKRRETSSSRHKSSKHEDAGPLDREIDEMMLRVTKKEREPSRERIHRDWEIEQDRSRDKGRDAKSDIDRNREYRRDADRGRSRDRVHGREGRRDDSVSLYRDRDQGREVDWGRDKYRGRDRHDDEADRFRRYRHDDHDNGHGNRDRRHGYDEREYRHDRNRKHESEKDRASKDASLKQNEDVAKREEDNEKDYQERVEMKLAEQEEDDVDKIKEESRRRKEAILQKYKVKPSQQQVADQDSQASVEELKEQPSQNRAPSDTVQEANDDAKSDNSEASGVDKLFILGKSSLRNGTLALEKFNSAGGLGEGSPKSERSNDTLCDDIFGDSPAGVRNLGKGDVFPVERSGLHDNWDDAEGYYSFRFGEILDSRYEVTAAHGKGVFSTVVRAKDLKAGDGDPAEVAIKIIRNNETMLKAGTEELVILKKLVGADPDDKRHCVRYLSHFKYRNHLCIVFESLHMNLREVLKKFGRNIGLSLTAVRAYAMQLFLSLKHLRNCGVLHCDIKPDNMLVNDQKIVLKLCDFGNAMFAGKNEITPYLVSRFYRAPEIILGLPYDHPMDMWSVGCCLYELFTGKVLFPGATNNDMLRLNMELKGPFPKKMLRKGAFIEQHFDQDLNFLAIEEDPVTKKAIRRLMVNIKPKDIGAIIKGSSGEDPKMLANFKDLLDKIFILDPDRRLTVSQALNHPFFTGK